MSDSPLTDKDRGGIIGWMVRNRITPNIMMLTCLLGGLFMATRIKQEVFPEFSPDTVSVRVAYPGASPEEVEQGIILAVEEAIRGVDGVKEITAVASEGSGMVTAELTEDADRQKTYQDIQQEVDRIRTFHGDVEDPVVTLNVRKREVVELLLHGQVKEAPLRETAELVRDRLLQHEGISQVELVGAREYEIQIELTEEARRRYNLTIDELARRIRRAALETPGGKIETTGGEILLRVTERRDWARQFARLPILVEPDGTLLRLEQIADVREDFEDTDAEATFAEIVEKPEKRSAGGEDGDSLAVVEDRAIGVEVFRIGEQTPIGVSDAVKEAMAEIEKDLPAGINWSIRQDRSDIYRQRLELLLRNAFLGLILVLLLLGLFLEFRLAFWVTMGIPTSFLGGMLFLPWMDVSINMISMFAFIIALGIVVDDAIVAGENIYEYRQKGMGLLAAAIQGAKDITLPVTFSILTNVVAFLPLYFVPGFIGKIWRVIPLVVCTVFLISLVEALFILPAHLAHVKRKQRTGLSKFLHDRQQAFMAAFRRFVQHRYGPFLRLCMHYRSVTLAVGVGILIITLAYIGSGHLKFILMPRVESDVSVVTATLPYGSAMSKMRQVRRDLVQAGKEVIEEHGGRKLSEGIFSRIRDNQVEIRIYLTDPKIRPITTSRLTELWRKQSGAMPDLESLKFESDRGGPGGGRALTVELRHRNIQTLDRASEALAEKLSQFTAVKDIDDGYTPGKRQLDFRITPWGQSLGLTAEDLAGQIRHNFQGVEAIRQQRGRNEVTVRIRRAQQQRVGEYDIERMIVQTPTGGQVPLADVATVTRGRAYTTIDRRNAARTVTVTADVEPIGETATVKADLDREILPQLERDFPGLTAGYQGRQADAKESLQALVRGMLMALVAIYVLLAIPFRSYTQPIVVMLAIPFGVVGATAGHLIMGYNLSIISLMGIVALSGVVVNDSLVLIDYANRLVRQEGLTPFEAVCQAGVRRFRPIMLTTLTTFGGLAPMIFETSRQARFMIPMALSLGYGILFATCITLVFIPAMYLVLEDIRVLLRKLGSLWPSDEVLPDPAEQEPV